MHKTQVWSRRAQNGPVGFAALYPVGEERHRPVRGAADRDPGLASTRPYAAGAVAYGQYGQVLVGPPVRDARAQARAGAVARQRLVLTVLLAALAVPTVAAVATGSTVAWWVVVAFLPVVLTYVAVLFRTRRIQAEKEFNLAFSGGPNLATAGLEEIFSARYEVRRPAGATRLPLSSQEQLTATR